MSDTLVLDMPMKESLELVTTIGLDGVNPEGELGDDMISEAVYELATLVNAT